MFYKFFSACLQNFTVHLSLRWVMFLLANEIHDCLFVNKLAKVVFGHRHFHFVVSSVYMLGFNIAWIYYSQVQGSRHHSAT